MRRRRFLLGTGAVCMGVSGCAGLISDAPMLSLTIFNHSDRPFSVEMTLLRTDQSTSRSDARAFSGRLDVEPDGQTVREDVAETQPYVIEYGLYEDNSFLTDQDHVHYYPADDGEDDSQAFDIDESGVLTRR